MSADKENISQELRNIERLFSQLATTLNIQRVEAAFNSLQRTLENLTKQTSGFDNTLKQVQQSISAVNGVGQTLVTTYNSMLTIQDAVINAQMGYVDQLVDLYGAQIGAIQAQNTYTQALALHAFAVQAYGNNSQEAYASQLALNYQMALYNQALKDQTVAQTAYRFAWLNTIGQIIAAAMAPAQQALSTAGAFGTVGEAVAGAQTGGTVAESGLAVIHSGEEIVTAELVSELKGLLSQPRNVGSLPFNMSATFNIAGSDATNISKQIYTQLSEMLGALFRNRGVY